MRVEIKTPEKEVPKAQQHIPVQLERPEPVQKEPENSSHGTVTQAASNSSQVDTTTTGESFRVPDERTSSTPPSKGSKPISNYYYSLWESCSKTVQIY